MKTRVNVFFVLLTLVVSAFAWQGCTSDSQPSDGDIAKAIDASGVMKRTDGSLTVVPPVVVVNRWPRKKDGSWPVQVKFTLLYKMPDGRTSPPTETTTSFRIFREKDKGGKSAWKAQPGF